MIMIYSCQSIENRARKRRRGADFRLERSAVLERSPQTAIGEVIQEKSSVSVSAAAISAHRLGEAPDRFFPAAAGRAVGDDRDLLDTGLLDALDLRAALDDGAGDGAFVHQSIADHLGVVRLLVHVMAVVAGFADLGEHLLLVGFEHIGQRMGDDARS